MIQILIGEAGNNKFLFILKCSSQKYFLDPQPLHPLNYYTLGDKVASMSTLQCRNTIILDFTHSTKCSGSDPCFLREQKREERHL